ncbi:MAG: hypothetical protein HOP15_13855 [Planctomycetes bacterium]|nr:hypothetical protein [Planctomycetota bacterium]
MSSSPRPNFEPWAWIAFALAAASAGLLFFLGLRPGGSAPVLVYRFGLLLSGWASAVAMLLALLWSLRRRPVLQRGRAWPLAALAASLWFCSLPFAYPSSHEGRFSPTRFRLPFEGTARVRFGGERKAENPFLFDPARRFGTAFEARGGEPLAVCAPAAYPPLGRSGGRRGEVLVLATGAREYCVLEGLVPNSCALASGATVNAGDPLGVAHEFLTAHLQDHPEPGRGEGVPMRYWNYLANGRSAEVGVPVPPQEVACSAAGPAIGSAGR